VFAHANSQAILTKLKSKAYQALERHRSGATSSLRGSLSSLLPEVGGDDELAMFGGQTRVLVSRILSQQNRRKVKSSSVPVSAADPSQSAASTPPASDDSHSPSSESIPEVHPTLVEFLQMLPPSSMSSLTTAGTGATPTAFQNQGNVGVNSLPPMFEFMSPNSAPSLFSSPATQAPSSISDSSFQSPFTQPNLVDTTNIKVDDDINELGLFLSGDSGMDERWKSFMRDSGIWDGAQNYDLMMNI
jgi:hypothetical protein